MQQPLLFLFAAGLSLAACSPAPTSDTSQSTPSAQSAPSGPLLTVHVVESSGKG